MPMSDDDFEKHLNTLGLQSAPMSFEETSPVTAGDDVVGTQTGEGVQLEAAPQPTMLPDAEHESPHDAAVASTVSEPQTMEPSEPAQTEQTPAPASSPSMNPAVSSVVKNPAVADYMNQRMSQQDPMDQQIADAQEVANKRRLFANIGNAFNDIAHAGSNQKIDSSYFENLSKNADSGVQDLATRQKMASDKVLQNVNKSKLQQLLEDNETSGPAADAVRSFYTPIAKRLGINPEVLKGLSPRQQKEYIEKPAEFQDRELTRQAQAKQSKDYKDIMMGRKQENDMSKFQDKFLDRISPEAKGFNNEVRKQIDLSVSADRAQQVMDQYKQPDGTYKIPPERLGDLNLSVVNLLTNGKSSVHALKSITPKNVNLDGASIAEWISSNPVGVDQTKWMQDYQALLNRESHISKKFTKDYLDSTYNSMKQNDLYKSYKKGVQDPKEDFFENAYQNKLQQFNLTNVDTKPAADHSNTEGGNTAPKKQAVTTLGQPPSSSDLVNVISPEGKPGKMPRANLEKAIQRGFQEVKGAQ
jgi:hypothetical protein